MLSALLLPVNFIKIKFASLFSGWETQGNNLAASCLREKQHTEKQLCTEAATVLIQDECQMYDQAANAMLMQERYRVQD